MSKTLEELYVAGSEGLFQALTGSAAILARGEGNQSEAAQVILE